MSFFRFNITKGFANIGLPRGVLKTSKLVICDNIYLMIEMILYSLVAPLVLLLVASFWTYPAVLEEVVKWLALKLGDKQRVNFAVGSYVGMAFGVSESILYTMNAWNGGDWGPIALRLVLTVPMHSVTAGITGESMRRGRGYLGLVIAMMIHVAFNYVVGLMA